MQTTFERNGNQLQILRRLLGTSIRFPLECFFFLSEIACVFVERFYISLKSKQIVRMDEWRQCACMLSIVMKLSFCIFWSWFMLIRASVKVATQHRQQSLSFSYGWETHHNLVIKQRPPQLWTGIRQPHLQLNVEIFFYNIFHVLFETINSYSDVNSENIKYNSFIFKHCWNVGAQLCMNKIQIVFGRLRHASTDTGLGSIRSNKISWIEMRACA